MRGAVAIHYLLHAVLQYLFVLLVLHVNEVDNNYTSQVAQAQLATNFFGSLHVYLQGVAFLVAVHGAAVAAVYVNNVAGFGLLYNNVTAVRHVHRFAKAGFYLLGNTVVVEYWNIACVTLHNVFFLRGIPDNVFFYFFSQFNIVSYNFVELGRKQITQNTGGLVHFA